MHPEEQEFERGNQRMIKKMGLDREFQERTQKWFKKASELDYSYHFRWMGRPIIQYPQDIVAMQELIWQVQPDLIIETGVARGGSVVFYASMLELLKKEGTVVGIDVDIREHNRDALENHPMFHRIQLFEGSSVAPEIVNQVQALAEEEETVMVCLDSLHTHDHVLAELEAYAPLVSPDSYCVVFDTIIEELPQGFFDDRPWDVGNSPMTAMNEFLKSNDQFEIDQSIHEKLGITVAPSGYLRKIK